MRLDDAIAAAADELRRHGVDDPRRQATLLLMAAIGRPRDFTIAYPEYELAAAEAETFSQYIARRANREPLQYITGRQEFYGIDIRVEPGVLIPRPETELLVEKALEFIQPLNAPRVLEIGVGSGCVSVAILKNAAHAFIIATDISDIAIRVAGGNAAAHRVSDRLSIRRGETFGDITDRFDLIVSNPPYIPEAERDSLAVEVAGNEPPEALFGGHDGLVVIRDIIASAPRRLLANGGLMLEIGQERSEEVRALFDPAIWQTPLAFPDLQGIERIIVARLAIIHRSSPEIT
jgi:release factor glutamine methyltransferase